MSMEPRALRPARRSTGRRPTGSRLPNLEALEVRDLMAVDFTTALGLNLGVNPVQALPSVSVAVADDGSTFLAGTFVGTRNFNPGGTAVNGTSVGGNDIFVARYNANGTLAWLKTYGDTGYDAPTGIALGGPGNSSVFVVGEFTGTIDFDKVSGGAPPLSTGNQNRFDGFVLKLDAANGNFGYSTQFAGPTQNANGAENLPTAVTANAAGDAFVGGRFQTKSTFGAGGTLTANGQGYDGYVTRLNVSGGVTWVKQLTPSTTSNAWVKGIAVDSDGSVLMTGQFSGQADFDPGVGQAILGTSTTNLDAFAWKLDGNGAYQWAKRAGSLDYDVGEGIAVDAAKNVYVTGKYTSPADGSGKYPAPVDFGGGGSPVNLWSRAKLLSDVFVWKLDTGGNVQWARGINIPNDANEPGRGAIAVDQSTGNVLVGGSFVHALPGDNRGNDIFVAQINPAGTFIGLRSGGGTGSLKVNDDLTLLNNNVVQSLAVNSNGLVAVAGINSLGNATFGNSTVSGDTFVAKLQANNTSRKVEGDFDGDGRTDSVVYDVYTSRFYISMTSLGNQAIQFGPGSNDGARPTPIIADYDGDGRADPAVFDALRANSYISHSTTGNTLIQFGPGVFDGADPVPAIADYDSDGKADLTVYNRKDSSFYIARSRDGNIRYQFGPGTLYGGTPEPIPADYDGDGKADPAVFNAATAEFYVAGWTGTVPGGRYIRQFGPGNTVPVVADYDNDGKADIAVYDTNDSSFYISRSSFGGFPAGNIRYQFGPGGTGALPIVADYDGDGKADPAVFNPRLGEFYIAGWNGNTPVGRFIKQFGSRGVDGFDVVPILGDFDGDGKADYASFQRQNAIFYLTKSSLGTNGNQAIQFGQGTIYGGAPIPLPISRHLLLSRKWS